MAGADLYRTSATSGELKSVPASRLMTWQTVLGFDADLGRASALVHHHGGSAASTDRLGVGAESMAG